MLEIDSVMRELIANGQPLTAIRAQARKNGMLYLQEVGLQKVMEGVTGMNEMLRVLRDEEGVGPPPGAK
jgi:type II secretory ATPase GspE/PulE/Tfp pilus assembly ATPase PilB-like protein